MIVFLYFLSLSVLVAANILTSKAKERRIRYWFNEFSHLLGGFLVAGLISQFFVSGWLILIGIAVVGLLWELMEYLINANRNFSRFFGVKMNWKIDHVDLKDSLLDVFLDIVGVLIFLTLIH